MPKTVSKGNAILKLKNILGCDKIIAFGDAENDIAMFEIADECYVVKNGSENLKKIADGIIESNEEDGVAKWLIENLQ